MTLTPKQLETLRYLRDYRREHAISPTLEEMAKAAEVSKVSIFERLHGLKAKRLVGCTPRKSRSWELTRAGEALFARTPCPVSIAVRRVLDTWLIQPSAINPQVRRELEAALNVERAGAE